MTTYTVFIGGWNGEDDPDRIIFRARRLSWDEARSRMSKLMTGFEGDICEVCAHDAKEALDRLRVAEPGRFEAEIDGDDYLILEDQQSSPRQKRVPVNVCHVVRMTSISGNHAGNLSAGQINALALPWRLRNPLWMSAGVVLQVLGNLGCPVIVAVCALANVKKLGCLQVRPPLPFEGDYVFDKHVWES